MKGLHPLLLRFQREACKGMQKLGLQSDPLPTAFHGAIGRCSYGGIWSTPERQSNVQNAWGKVLHIIMPPKRGTTWPPISKDVRTLQPMALGSPFTT